MSNNYKQLLETLKEEEKNYKLICSNIKTTFSELEEIKNESIILVNNIVELIQSIKKVPLLYSYNPKIKKINNKLDSVNSKEIEEKERRRELIGTSSALVGMISGGVVLYSFKDFFKKICKGRNILVWILAIVLFLVIFISYLIYKRFSKIKACKEAIKQIEKLNEESQYLLTEIQVATESINNIKVYYEGLSYLYNYLLRYHNYSYKDIEKIDVQNMKELINKTIIFLKILEE